MHTPLEVFGRYPQHSGSLTDLFDSRRMTDPDRAFLRHEGREHTWQGFHEQILGLAWRLRNRGVGKGDRVAIMAGNSDAHPLLLMALARLGAALVPLNPEFGIREAGYILTHADVCGVVVAESTLAVVTEALAGSPIDPWVMQINGEGEDALVGPAPAGSPASMLGEAQDTCVIIYTSGTTGLPKGVMHSQRSLALCAEIAAARVRLQPDDKVLIVLPFFHVNALFYSFASILAAGASGTILPRFSARTFWESVIESGATQVNIIEAVGNILQKRPRSEFRPGHRLRVVYGVRPAFSRTFREEFGVPQLVTGFGMSECPGVICNPLEGPAKQGSIGIVARHPDPAVQEAEARIVDDEGHDLSAGEVGELWLKSPTMMQGYFRDPEQTKAAFRDGWFITGDLLRCDEDGYFQFVSRKKDIIRRRGENISGAELDSVIGEHPDVYEVAAIAVPAELGEDEILAAVVTRPGVMLRAEDIADWCRDRLAPMKVPRYVLFMDSLPHTPTHKVSKAALRADPRIRAEAIDLQAPD